MARESGGLATVEEAIEAYRAGHLLIVVDEDSRESQGALTVAAEFITPDAVAFMAQHGRGLICVPMTGERLDELRIPTLQAENRSAFGTLFTVPVEARHGVTTGISAQDRAHTVRVLISPRSTPADVSMPGHVFPLRVREGGVLVRAGHAEATVDLAQLAGLYPAAVLCEITKGTAMAHLPDIKRFAKRHGINVLSIRNLITYRLSKEQLVTCVTQAALPTDFGDFRVHAYRSTIDPDEHIALVMGDVAGPEPPLVRVQSECLAGDVFGSTRCACSEQMRTALRLIAEEGRGLFLYMRQEGRGIGLHNRLRSYTLPGAELVADAGAHASATDNRDYGIGMQILRDLGVSRMRLLTNSAGAPPALEAYGLEVVGHLPLPPAADPAANERTAALA
jgi:3,4-dihydroxy 2-butanone 4-phosphate synthase/GTP cyclohydrolase II